MKYDPEKDELTHLIKYKGKEFNKETLIDELKSKFDVTSINDKNNNLTITLSNKSKYVFNYYDSDSNNGKIKIYDVYPLYKIMPLADINNY